MLIRFNVGRSKKLWVSNAFNTVRGVGEELRRCNVSRTLMFFFFFGVCLNSKGSELYNCANTFVHDCKIFCSRCTYGSGHLF